MVATIKNLENSVSKDVKKLELLCTVGGSAKWFNQYGKQHDRSPPEIKN